MCREVSAVSSLRASIAGHCLHIQPTQRPTMAEVAVKLEFILSQKKKESASSVGDGKGLICKLRSLFTGKLVDAAIEDRSDLIEVDAAIGSKSDFSSHRKPIVSTEYSPNLYESIYKNWFETQHIRQ